MGGIKRKKEASLPTPTQDKHLNRVQDYMPSSYATFRRAYDGTSMRAAVNAKCIDCSCYQKAEVRDCVVDDCPLWRFRPYQ